MSKKRYGNELHPLYLTWQNINQRCNNPDNTGYHLYGGKGIKLSDEFRNFKTFATYMENLDKYSERVQLKLSIDRIDGSLGYQRGNLRWVCKTTQTINSSQRTNSRSKYVGVCLNTTKTSWMCRINMKGKVVFSKNFSCEEEARKARNAFILENNLPHKIQNQVK